MNMNTPEKGQREMKSEITEEEQSQIDALEAAADAARVAGVYDPSEVEGEK
ncbi:MAG: hypothetical protein G01um101491_291 [Parcubacteria group bacterium Gr01-1014_91]|nr:MAG: hypothetical protein G01um101491_291 [Parcubacteria group bacterium Gr01-1014_91]